MLKQLSEHARLLDTLEYWKSLQFAFFWGKGRPANCEICELRGMFSMKTLEMGENGFQSPNFGTDFQVNVPDITIFY